MIDQAQKLRDLVTKSKSETQITIAKGDDEATTKKSAKIICVTSGKGGVGKTNFTINSAVSLSNIGKRVVLLDADFGLANVDVLFGIISKYNLSHVISGEKKIEEILTTGPNNIKFISGGSGIRELLYMEEEALKNLVDSLQVLDELADIIIIDTGAGISESVVSFVLASDEIVVVTTPEPTAITDAYALIKTIVNLDRSKRINLVINRAENKREADEVFQKINSVCSKFLNYDLSDLGYIYYDNHVIKAVKMQKPFTLLFPNCQASKTLYDVVNKLQNKTSQGIISQNNTGLKSLFNRLLHFKNI